jgi:hypothetical protein
MQSHVPKEFLVPPPENASLKLESSWTWSEQVRWTGNAGVASLRTILGALGYCVNGSKNTNSLWIQMGFPEVPKIANRIPEISRLFSDCSLLHNATDYEASSGHEFSNASMKEETKELPMRTHRLEMPRSRCGVKTLKKIP